MNSNYTVAVIGAGLAGIAVALRLNRLGYKVLVLEKNATHGGKMGEVVWNNYRWDRGPSLFTLPEQVDELFELYGKNPREYFNYKRMSESCHYYFEDGTDFLFKSNKNQRDSDLIEHFGDSGKNAINYLKDCETTYKNLGTTFIDKPQLRVVDLLKIKMLPLYRYFFSQRLMRSLNGWNKKTLKNPKLVQVFNRYGTYNGSNPYKMSGLYGMVAHLEHNHGTFFPFGGMRSIVDSLFLLAVENGVEFLFDQDNISCQFADKGIVQANGEVYQVDKVIAAIDCVTFYKDVLKDQSLASEFMQQERSSSGLVFYWAVEKILPELGLHNILFSGDYEKEFREIFDQKKLPTDPTVYIHVSSVTNSNDAPTNGQNWFVMINTPAGVSISDSERDKLKKVILTRIKSKLNVNIEPFIMHESYWDTAQIGSDTGSYLGALYGASSNDKMSGFNRHGNQSDKYENLYFCGGTVHPGGGIPLVLKSAKIVEELIKS